MKRIFVLFFLLGLVTSCTKYADDVVKMILAPPNESFPSAMETALVSMQAFDAFVSEAGYAQNRDKLLGILALDGAGSRRFVQDIANKSIVPSFSCVLAARSLCSIISHDCSANAEVLARIAAVQRAEYKRGRAWSLPFVPFEMKRLLLICDVQKCCAVGPGSFCYF